MKDVGEQVASKSGGLLQIARCNLGQPERDCQKVLINKLKLSLQVEKSQLGPWARIPVLKMQSWFQFLLRNGCMHVLHGLKEPHAAREEAILSEFWEKFQALNPQHMVFQKGSIPLKRAVPVVVHGDEGRGRRHSAHFVLSFHSLLGMGFGKRKESKKWTKMECNFQGHTYTNRFLIATLRKKDYSDQGEVWKALMQQVAIDSRSLWETGVSDATGTRYFGIVLGVIGDWPFLHKSAAFSRSFNNIQKRVTVRNPPAGICHLCRSGQLDVAFEQVSTRRPDWLMTAFTQSPFLAPSPFVQHLLLVPGQEPALWMFDWFHTMHLGVVRNYVGSVIALLSEQEPCGSIDDRFESLNQKYQTWCKNNPSRSYFAKISKEAIQWETTGKFPSAGWHKGCLSTSWMSYLEDRFALESFDAEPLLGVAAEACDALQQCSKTLYASGVWLDPSVAGQVAQMGLKFLRRYAQMADMSKLAGRCLFVFQPKIHVLHHFCVDMWGAYQRNVYALNVLATSCQPSEDFIGRPSRLARRVTPRSPVLNRIMDRYLESAYHHFLRSGYLIRPGVWKKCSRLDSTTCFTRLRFKFQPP